MNSNAIEWRKMLLSDKKTLRCALEVINELGCHMILVVDSNTKLVGTLSDGDARRALLSGLSLSDPLAVAMNTTPKVVNEDTDALLRSNIMRRFGLDFLPVIKSDKTVVGIEFRRDQTLQPIRNEWVVVMAGGMGTRLQEMTRDIPKPMLRVGSRPLLETTIRLLSKQGFINIFLAVNYKAEVIESYFGDGSQFGVNIKYLREKIRLGTAGALSLLPDQTMKNLLVTNADLLTNIDFNNLLNSHIASNAAMTIGVREHEIPIPFGVIHDNNGSVFKVEEKPTLKMSVNGGIYALSLDAVNLVPSNSFFNMTDLLNLLLIQKKLVRSHSLEGSWLDIGRPGDFEKANEIYNSVKI